MPICQHLDIRKSDEIRCCLSCGEAIVEDFQENAQEYDYTVTSGYQYRRLNYKLGQEIRLVVVFPGSGNEVRCDIIHANLLDEPSYEATSYTWATATGDKTLSHHVVCRGGRIPITRNCLVMLRRLRRSDTSRTLWVDAISIDQNNLDEKNHQVKLMSTIYSKASQVLAYLGPMSDETREVVHKIVDEIADKTDTGGSFTDKPCLNRRQLRIFLDLPYFNRVWVRTSPCDSRLRDTLTRSGFSIDLTRSRPSEGREPYRWREDHMVDCRNSYQASTDLLFSGCCAPKCLTMDARYSSRHGESSGCFVSEPELFVHE
jgi:hypothetical protein